MAKHQIKCQNPDQTRISQGDIIKDIENKISLPSGDIISYTFPYAIILSQDCDLAQDFTQRFNEKESKNNNGLIFSVLVLPLYEAALFRKGTHLSGIGWEMENINSERYKIICSNNNPRYHYLSFSDTHLIEPSIIDFKHFFTIDIQQFYLIRKEQTILTISSLYREQISHRFVHYLSRIGLPD